jgi:class 3 adenylate cyclase
MSCDLVGSGELASRLDPEDLRTLVRAYPDSAAEVIRRFDGRSRRPAAPDHRSDT